MNKYSQFMLIEIAKDFDIINKDLDYDLMWDVGGDFLNEFKVSKFNVDTKSEYDCMVDFFDNKKKEIEREKEEQGTKIITLRVTKEYVKSVEVEITVPKKILNNVNELDAFVSNSVKIGGQIEHALLGTSLDSTGDDVYEYITKD